VSARPEAAALAALQARFAAALRDPQGGAGSIDPALAGAVRDDGIAPAARLAVYRNNARAMFSGALGRTFPVLARRVGPGYFERLASEYRAAHPSRSGDLHWIGSAFPAWLEARLAGTEYAWLADLARLEWACEEVLVAADSAAIGVDALAAVDPGDLADLRVGLQPALRCVHSAYPVWSVWRENQPDASGAAVDLGLGAEHVVVTRTGDRPLLHLRPEAEVRFVAALAGGRTLGMALGQSGLPVDGLANALAWLFGHGLVVTLDAGNAGDPGDPA
jgi:Putative DNA-binding domain